MTFFHLSEVPKSLAADKLPDAKLLGTLQLVRLHYIDIHSSMLYFFASLFPSRFSLIDLIKFEFMQQTNILFVIRCVLLSIIDWSDEEGTTKPTTVRKTGGKRGPCYTPKEDRIICESFMAASENPIVGTSQKGRTFREEI
jgi:hypothetical protein